jgi:type IV pilus assembly protein PilO
MNKFNELPLIGRLGIILAIGAVIFAAAWYGPVPGLAAMKAKNEADMEQLKAKQADNAKLRPYEGKLAALETQLASLQLQMERQKKIVPDVESADDFIREMETAGATAGINIRGFERKPPVGKQYYTEVPFDIEVDGPYYAVLSFFEKVGTMERIVNMDSLKMTAIGGKTSATKHRYEYLPNESVTVACTAKTFYSKVLGAPAGTAPAPAATTVAQK